jgi:sulfide dehydrogenase cytochrome subunit
MVTRVGGIMNIKHVVVILIALFLFLLFSTALSRAHAQEDAKSALPSAEMLAFTCVGCHGDRGASHGPASPSIAGISIDYFMQTMKAYQSGERPATIMGRMAKGYNETELMRLGEYFSRQPIVFPPQVHDPQQARLGKRLHNTYCELCHEDGGRRAENHAGILAGQWAPYLRMTLEDFIQGARPMDKTMEQRLKQLQAEHGQAGLEALIHYYVSQR